MNFVLVVFFAADYVFGTAHDTLSLKDFVHQKPLKLRQILMLLHRGSASITFHVFFEAPIKTESVHTNIVEIVPALYSGDGRWTIGAREGTRATHAY